MSEDRAAYTVPGARVLRLTVPVPAQSLNPNARVGRYGRARAASQQRTAWCYAALRALGAADFRAPLFAAARLSVLVTWCTGRRVIDDDNLIAALKAGRDGLKDAGIVVDDSPRHLTTAQVAQQRCGRGCHCGGRVAVTVEEITFE